MPYFNENTVISYAGWEKITIKYTTHDFPEVTNSPEPLFTEVDNFFTFRANISFYQPANFQIELEWSDGRKITEIITEKSIYFRNTLFTSFPEIKYSLKDRVLIINSSLGKFVAD